MRFVILESVGNANVIKGIAKEKIMDALESGLS
jgi:hypothetical protein